MYWSTFHTSKFSHPFERKQTHHTDALTLRDKRSVQLPKNVQHIYVYIQILQHIPWRDSHVLIGIIVFRYFFYRPTSTIPLTNQPTIHVGHRNKPWGYGVGTFEQGRLQGAGKTQTRKKNPTDGRHRKFLGAGGCILMAGIYGCFQKKRYPKMDGL